MILSIALTGDNQDFDLAEIIGYAAIIIASSTIFIAIRSYRDKHNGGIITFGKAFVMGICITLIASAIHTASWMVYYSAGPGKEMMEGYYQKGLDEVKNDNDLAEKEKEEKLQEMDQMKVMFSNPIMIAIITFLVEVPPIGLSVSLLSALILMRKKPKQVIG